MCAAGSRGRAGGWGGGNNQALAPTRGGAGSAEGARGSLSKIIIAKYGLHQGRQPQKFGIGLKELWQVTPDKHQPGLVQHSFGWPLDNSTGGGSFLSHFDD